MIESNADGAITNAQVEHNRPALGQGDEKFSIPTGALAVNAWSHVRFDVAFVDVEGENGVSFQVFVGDTTTPVIPTTTRPAPFASSPFARVRLIPFHFGEQDRSMYFDNAIVRVATAGNGLLPRWNGVER